MQTTWRCQKFRRIKYQPAEMKMVLTKLSVALIAGKSETEITLKLEELKRYIDTPCDSKTFTAPTRHASYSGTAAKIVRFCDASTAHVRAMPSRYYGAVSGCSDLGSDGRRRLVPGQEMIRPEMARTRG